MARKPTTMRFDEDLRSAAKAKAKTKGSTLTAYVETLIEKDLGMSSGPKRNPRKVPVATVLSDPYDAFVVYEDPDATAEENAAAAALGAAVFEASQRSHRHG